MKAGMASSNGDLKMQPSQPGWDWGCSVNRPWEGALVETLKAWVAQELWVASTGILGGATLQPTCLKYLPRHPGNLYLKDQPASRAARLPSSFVGADPNQRHYRSFLTVLCSLTPHTHHRTPATG